MDSKPHLHKKVEETLNSLDNISPASPAPFFFTRLEARLRRERSNFWERAGSFLGRPAIAFLSVGLVVALNTLAFVEFSSSKTLTEDQQEIAAADEYNRTVSTFNYNIDNVLP